MGSSRGLFPVGPNKVKAPKSIIFIEDSPEVKIKNTCIILSYFASMLYAVVKSHIQHQICRI